MYDVWPNEIVQVDSRNSTGNTYLLKCFSFGLLLMSIFVKLSIFIMFAFVRSLERVLCVKNLV